MTLAFFFSWTSPSLFPMRPLESDPLEAAVIDIYYMYRNFSPFDSVAVLFPAQAVSVILRASPA